MIWFEHMAALFEVATPLGCTIRTTKDYWQYLIEKKHPSMASREAAVMTVLKDPEEIRKSAVDPSVYLYYRRVERLYCVVARHQTHSKGFLITAYPADKVKEGEIIWKK